VHLSDGRTAELSPDLVVRERLSVGSIISSDEHWHSILAAQARLDARFRLIRLLSTRRKTRREAEDYLTRLGFPPDAVDHAVQAAEHLGYLNDEAYAGAYARTKDRTQKEGPRSIAAGLGRRGVDREIIDETIAPLEPEEVQKPKALVLAQKRWASQQTSNRKSSKATPREEQAKLAAYLLRRGFSPDIVYAVVEKVTGHSPED
jgi:regulatory protein